VRSGHAGGLAECAGGPGFQEGTLKAVTARLGYIAELGAAIVYLSPIQRMSAVGGFTNPYRISDYDAIDPEYGTEADLRALVEAAHNPKLRKYLIGNLLHWVREAGVDGFRCDVAAGIPLDFWEQARAELDQVNREVILLAESDLPEEQLQAFDISYNFPYYEALAAVIRDGEPATRIREQWEKARARFPRGARLLHLSDNHDRERADVVFSEKGALAIRWDRRARSTAIFKRLFQMRREEAALSAGELIWINNSAPDNLVSFLRKRGDQEILVVINLSNRKCAGAVDLPVSEYPALQDLIKNQRIGFSIAPGKVTFNLGTFEYIVGKRIPPRGWAASRALYTGFTGW